MIRPALRASVLALGIASVASAGPSSQDAYTEQTGKALYSNICQGCHMPDGRGAVGAGTYPALAGNQKLAAKAYPALVILGGAKAMPSFGDLSDAQVANVVNYIRSNFGTRFADSLAPNDVKALRAVAR